MNASFFAIRDIFDDVRKQSKRYVPGVISCYAKVSYETDKSAFNFTRTDERVHVLEPQGISGGRIRLLNTDAERYHIEFEAKYQQITYANGVIMITGNTTSKEFSRYSVTISDIRWEKFAEAGEE